MLFVSTHLGSNLETLLNMSNGYSSAQLFILKKTERFGRKISKGYSEAFCLF